MTIHKLVQEKIYVKASRVLALLLAVFVLSMVQSAFADGFGVSDNSSNAAKINALLQSVQASSNQNQSAASAPATQAAATTNNAQAAAPAADSVGDAAFANMVRTVLPLTPEQIKTLHYLFNKSQQAAAQYPGIPPKPTSTSLNVNLSPGAAPPVVLLEQGYVSSLVFVDATGAPWPIQAYDLGNQKSFNIQWDQKSNTLMVQALSNYDTGNLAVMLKGLDTPVMITLMSGQRAVDYRVDLRIPKLGPNANLLLAGLPNTASPQLLDILDGVPPQGAQQLVVQGGGEDCQAWLINGMLYLRTTMTVLSPAFISTMGSPDGTHAYELQATPIILAYSRGKTIQLTVEGL